MLDNDFVLKQKVDSVLAGYADVQLNVKNGVAILSGTIEKNKAGKLMQALHQLPLNSIVNNVAIK